MFDQLNYSIAVTLRVTISRRGTNMELVRRVVLGMIVGGASVCAAPVTITFTGTATGTVGGTPFTNAAITVTVSGDTSNVANVGGGSFSLPYAANAAAFTISGIGSGTFTNSGSINANQNVFGGAANIFDNSAGLLITIED